MSNITLGLIQMSCTESAAANLEKAILKIREAKKQGAQIICLQELFNGPYFCQSNTEIHFKRAEVIPGPTTEALGKVAKELGVVVVASLYENDNNTYYNTACVLDADGKFLGKYRKVHIPDDPDNFYSELFYFKPGNLGYPVFKTKFGTIGLQVCWDQWYPEGARVLALAGAEIIFYPTAIGWPNKRKNDPSHQGAPNELSKAEYEAWETLQRGHAIANTVFVAAVNRTGPEENLDFWGGSFVADPLGRILKKASHHNEEILIVECDFTRMTPIRKDWPFLKCRRPSEYKGLV